MNHHSIAAVSLPLALYLLLSVWYFELIIRLRTVNRFLGIGLLYSLLFAAAFAGALAFICTLSGSAHFNRCLAGWLLIVLGVYTGVQIVYFGIFKTYFTFSSLGGAAQVTQFWREALLGIWHEIIYVLLIFVPGVLLLTAEKSFVACQAAGLKGSLAFAAAFAVLHFSAVGLILRNDAGAVPLSYIYRSTYIPETMVENFGEFATARLDIKYQFVEPQQSLDVPDSTDQAPSYSEEAYNVLPELDLSALAGEESDELYAALDRYCAGLEPTAKNDYTGLFEGKDIIHIVAESFSGFLIEQHPELFPTLTRLYNEGFQFTNFYTPLWAVSTLDGEYATEMGLIPRGNTWSLVDSAENRVPFCLGNQFAAVGYDSYSFHNNTYTYYSRDESHPNMGYQYTGVGNGLELESHHPYSDYEMMVEAWPTLAASDHYCAYFLTFSGHMFYDRRVNDMTDRNWEAVAELPYPDAVKGYIAANIELEKAVAYLVEQLEASGRLENTVITLSADHWPYGLSQADYEQLAGHSLDGAELYRNTFLLWSGSMEQPVRVDKPTSSLDILPTLSNLFGLPYDSRLLSGRDMLSGGEGLVVFKDYSFLTEEGYYNAATRQWISDVPADEEKLRELGDEVCRRFAAAAYMLKHDYYRHLGL